MGSKTIGCGLGNIGPSQRALIRPIQFLLSVAYVPWTYHLLIRGGRDRDHWCISGHLAAAGAGKLRVKTQRST